MYIVYIRVVQNRQSSFIRTSWMVNDKGVKGKDVTDPYVIQQTSNLISRYYSALNQINTSNWTASEVVAYLTTSAEDMSFSDYARKHIEKLIKRGQERTSRNYKWALNHMERFAHTDNIMLSRLKSLIWIETRDKTTFNRQNFPFICLLIEKISYLCTTIYILIEKNGKEYFATERTGNRNGDLRQKRVGTQNGNVKRRDTPKDCPQGIYDYYG